jgi:TetR/AcrR family transcriptional regulator, transcriptional repressor for nem operon
MASRRPENQAGTRSAILDSAERLVQRRGFNGFSYADVASELGITKAALHYHFPGKAELGEALIERYASRFADALAEIDAANAVAFERLRSYTDLYLGVLRGERMCMCGMLAAEYETLPDPMRQTVVGFFDDNVVWLSRLLRSGKADKSLRFTGKPEDAAQSIVGTLEGAMLVARSYGSTAKFEAVVSRILSEFASGPKARSRPI